MDLSIKPSEATSLLFQLRNLNQTELPGSIKYLIYRNIEKLDSYSKAFQLTQTDLVKTMGRPLNGRYIIPEFIGEDLSTINPNFEKYRKEIDIIDQPDTVKDLSGLPKELFMSEREFRGDLELVYKYMLA